MRRVLSFWDSWGTMVFVTTSQQRAVADALTRNREELATVAFNVFFSASASARTRIRATPAIADALSMLARSCDDEGNVPAEVEKRFLQRATTLCAHGLLVEDVASLSEAAHRGMLVAAGAQPFEAVLPVERALAQLTRTVVSRLQVFPPKPAARAEVVQIERRTRRLSVVRLQADGPVAYEAGQAVSISLPILPGTIEYHYPAIPSNEHGQIEFHIFHDPFAPGAQPDSLAALLAATGVGDVWQVGPPHGEEGGFVLDKKRETLLIAHGSGLAPIRAVLLDRLMKGPHNRTHLFLSADYPGELYDLVGLWQIAGSSPWLSVSPVSRFDEDAWWVNPTEHAQPPRGLHLRTTGEVAQVVAGFGAWADRDVLIAGPRAVVSASVGALRDAGTPRGHIQTRVIEQPELWTMPAESQHRAG